MVTKRPIVFVAISILSLLVALAPPAFAQRGGGGGGGGGGRSGGGAGGGAPHGGGGGGGNGGARQGGGAPGGPGHPGGGRPGYGPGRPVYGPGGGRYPYYGYGYRYYPYYGYYGYPYAYGWYGYPYFSASFGWGYPYGYPYYYGYGGGGGYDTSASLRLDVTPKEAEVYIDGYMVGTVDEFDGTFQRLHLPPGAHELTLYRDGFKTVHQSLRLSTGSTFKVSYKMEPLAAGEVAEPRPTPPPPPPDQDQGEGPFGGVSTSRAPQRRPPGSRAESGFGTLALRVQPGDAIVLIDGEHWQSSGPDRLVVELPDGPHRIEIQKDGFDTYSAEITITPGQTLPMNVSLGARR